MMVEIATLWVVFTDQYTIWVIVKKILNQYMNNPCYFVKIDWINIKINMFSPDNGFFSATLW
jgi:hypothetical protein